MTIVKIPVGTKKNGEPIILRMDRLLIPELERVKSRVRKKNWDYVALICGLPGSGKSTLARSLAKYFCPWFDNSYIAFDGDSFVEISNNCPDFSAVILDESFASLNSKITLSDDFIKIINHLQILRQKHLYIFLCLPNFFDLAKGVAIFRSSHLFVTYADEEGNRGFFLVFDRERKKKLYIKGNKYIDYNAEKANFYAKFFENKDIIDLEEYDRIKREHLMMQNTKDLEKYKKNQLRNKLLWKLRSQYKWKLSDLAKVAEISERSVENCIQEYRTAAKYWLKTQKISKNEAKIDSIIPYNKKNGEIQKENKEIALEIAQ